MTTPVPKVVATLLIRQPRETEEWYEKWTPLPDSQSHPGDISNLWVMYCYKEEDVLPNLEALMGLDGVQDVVTVYGKTTWAEYAQEHGLELQKHNCNHNGCKEFNGTAVMGEVVYYNGPL